MLCLLGLASCGGSSGTGTMVSAKTPIFTSAPVTAAAQGVAYAYQPAATDPSGGTVSFALTTSPAGAALSGNSVSWTPTASQSRTANSFMVTATTSEGATATQSWSVTPTGIVTVNWVNTYWEANGAVQAPMTPSSSLTVSAVVPEPDGSITVLKGSATAPGVISIAGVPAGSYWLAFGGLNLLPDSTSAYWTNTSTFDAGRDLAGPPPVILSSASTTTFALKLSGLDSVAVPTSVMFQPENHTLAVGLADLGNVTNLNITLNVESNIDWSQDSSLFLGQYEPSTLGPLTNAVLGPSVLLTNQSFVDGATNTITPAFQSTPASLDLSVQGSQWAAVLNNAGPAAATSYASMYSLIAEPWVTGRNVPGLAAPNLVLAATSTQSGLQFGFQPVAPGCDVPGFGTPAATPAILTDQNVGTLQYSDPFPSTWARAQSFCEAATVPIAIPNSSTTVNFALVSGASVAPSSSAIAPIVGAVQSPTVNGGSLFTAATLTTSTPSLSWTAPTGTAPTGYRVAAFVQTTPSGLQTYQPAGVFYTAQTSITLPPLSSGNTYVFCITSEADGSANFQTSPFRSALPTGFASVVSAPFTVSSSAARPQIRGDARVVRRLVQPVPRTVSDDSVHISQIKISR
jgi:hypothetical protein